MKQQGSIIRVIQQYTIIQGLHRYTCNNIKLIVSEAANA